LKAWTSRIPAAAVARTIGWLDVIEVEAFLIANATVAPLAKRVVAQTAGERIPSGRCMIKKLLFYKWM
jgi:hypothetical protein